MQKSADMRRVEKAINRVRNHFVGRAVMYYPTGTDYEAPAVIKDMSYDTGTWDEQTKSWGTWGAFIEYETRSGKMTGWRSLSELVPVGWKA